VQDGCDSVNRVEGLLAEVELDMDGPGNHAQQASNWMRAAGCPADADQVERRASARSRILKKGKLILPNNISVYDCLIRDISQTGARLTCEQTGLLPNELQLMFFAIREVRYVRVVWRRPGELGVEFLTPARPAPHLLL
jgi:hypothetical protein